MKNPYKHTNQQFFKLEITLQDQEMSLCQGKNQIKKLLCAQNRGISSNLSSSKKGLNTWQYICIYFSSKLFAKKKKKLRQRFCLSFFLEGWNFSSQGLFYKALRKSKKIEDNFTKQQFKIRFLNTEWKLSYLC